MNILFVAAEAAPFAKVGGLGDVIGSLPRSLRQQGVDARVLIPLYGFIDRKVYHIEPVFVYQFSRRNGAADVTISSAQCDGVPVYFLSSPPFFGDGEQLYTDWYSDMPRFIFFCQTILATIWQMKNGVGGMTAWTPDILHANDWHTALVSFLVSHSHDDPFWGRMGTVLSIHSAAYQGPNAGDDLSDADIPARDYGELVSRNLTDNLLGIGIAYSDIVTKFNFRRMQRQAKQKIFSWDKCAQQYISIYEDVQKRHM